MKAGETVRATCDKCDTEFEVTLEPKAKGWAGPPGRDPADQIDPQKATHCPFCGSNKVTTDEDE